MLNEVLIEEVIVDAVVEKVMMVLVVEDEKQVIRG